jgi:hypothetical protein
MPTDQSDRFEQRLDEALKQLRSCQKEHAVTTCSKCEYYIGCEIRKSYVQAVYDSMSKGETGGFEF